MEIERVCVNCKHIIPHVTEYIDGIREYNARCAKGKRSTSGKLFTILDRYTYTCDDFEIGANKLKGD